MSRVRRKTGASKRELILTVVESDSTFSWDDRLKKWDGDCLMCGSKVVVWPNGCSAATLEHLVPLSKGGDDSLENLSVMCSACNAEKAKLFDRNLDGPECSIVKALRAKRISRMTKRDEQSSVD